MSNFFCRFERVTSSWVFFIKMNKNSDNVLVIIYDWFCRDLDRYKIVCRLQVVMCGAVPAMVRSVSLYSTCSSGNVTVTGRTIKALGRDDHNAPYRK